MIIDKENVREYFGWLCNIIINGQFSDEASYTKLLNKLFQTSFHYSINNDANRARDGIDLRYRFALSSNLDEDSFRDGDSSILEMMIALAVRCEENIMDDPAYGNRTAQWFWIMITNLGFGAMYDSNYDESYVDLVLKKFVSNDYEPDGHGGLFVIKNCKYDLRTIEIWMQLCWFLDNMI